MALPIVEIIYENGRLNTALPNTDSVLGLACIGAPVTGGLQLGKAETIYSLDQLETDLLVTETNNPNLYRIVKQFYTEIGTTAELWLMAFPNTMTMESMLDPTQDNAKGLIDTANGRLRGLLVSSAGIVTPDALNMPAAITAAQNLCNYSTQKDAPMFALLAYEDYDGDALALPDLTQSAYNRVGVLIGDTDTNSHSAAIGLLGGRVAKIAIQRNIAAVRDGVVNSLTAFIYDKPVEQYGYIETLYAKGYITFRTHTGRSGYFFTDDYLASKTGDDYRSLTNRRIADKAHRIAQYTLSEELLSEIPVNRDGTLIPAFAKSWEKNVENAIALNMTANGNLSTDPDNPNDKGCKCIISTSQNVLSTSRIDVALDINPFAYARTIRIYLGFNVKQV